MKDFMMIFIGPVYEDLNMSPEVMQERYGRWFTWSEKMRASGALKGGHALHGAATRITSEKRTVSDGPFVEAKELVGGYYIVSAENKAAVIKMADDFPDYDLNGSVEIREVIKFEQ